MPQAAETIRDNIVKIVDINSVLFGTGFFIKPEYCLTCHHNISQFLGSEEEGQGTLCEDEADRIDEDRQKMAIYKNGYITGFPVARTDTSFGRKQLKLNTFCFKSFPLIRLLQHLGDLFTSICSIFHLLLARSDVGLYFFHLRSTSFVS
jgi:hypothetical protein